MADAVKVATKTEIPDGRGKLCEVGDRRIAVFHKDGQFYALDDTCTHLGASLAEGAVTADGVICPWHGALFGLEDGQCSGPPARGGVATYPCRIEGDDIIVEV